MTFSLLLTGGLICRGDPLRSPGAVDTSESPAPGDTISEVVVSGSRRAPLAVSSGVPVSSMSGSDIRALGLEGMADAMRMLGGAVVKDYGGIGGMKTVSVRNLGAQHTAVSYDGIVVSNTQAGQIDIGHFQTDNLSMLSLAVGQGSDPLQSARHYASAGVVSIETEEPHFDGGRPWKLRLGVEAGSWGQVSPKLRWWQRMGSRTRLSVDASFMRADGAYPFTLRNGIQTTREKRHNSDICQASLEANLHQTLRDSSQLKLKAIYYRSERGLPGVVILYNNNNSERLWDENVVVQATWKKNFSRRGRAPREEPLQGKEAPTIVVRAKYSHTWDKYEDYGVKYTGGVLTDRNTQNECYLSATLGWSMTEWLSAAIAEDVALNTLRTNVNDSPNPRRLTSLTALSLRAYLGRLKAEAALLATYATESLTESETYGVETPADRYKLSPSLNLSYRLLTGEDLYLRAMIKSTFRMPTFNDLYYLHIGNTALEPEKATEWGLGLAWSRQPEEGIISCVSLMADAYYDYVRDKIVAFPSTYVWKMANYGRVDILGLDATMALGLRLGPKTSLDLTATLTWQDARDKTDKGSQTYDSQLPYTPRWSGAASAILRTPWVNIGYTLTGQGERYSSSLNTEEYRLGAYTVSDISLSRTFSHLALSLTIHNIANRQYDIVRYYPMHGRSVNISANINI